MPIPRWSRSLAETLGVIVFQEQVLRVAMAVAGFTPGRGRPAAPGHEPQPLGSRRWPPCASAFWPGRGPTGVDEATAEEIWQQLAGFAGFGFCKSHAAAFALVAYQTLYLKAHYPAEFYCALLNHQPMGFYPPEVLVGDARRHGVPVLRPDVNRSQAACTLERGDDRRLARAPGLALRPRPGRGVAGADRRAAGRASRSATWPTFAGGRACPGRWWRT